LLSKKRLKKKKMIKSEVALMENVVPQKQKGKYFYFKTAVTWK